MCNGPSWKREVVPDHKFDFVDTREFTDNSFGMRMKYVWLYIIILKDFLVYCSDIFTAVTMLSTDSWSNAIFNSCPQTQTNGCIYIPFKIAKWLFFGCIIFSFLLLAYEARKAKKIIASRDISYAFTNVMANNYYSLRSYDHFCFFNHISNSTKRIDDFAFFVFFTFKSWKRLLLADGPRQSINALTLYAFYLSKQNDGPWYQISKYFDSNNLVTTGLTISTAFTVLVFAGSLFLLIIAGACYIPLLCHIQGNLKEYCCHKVDKRITEIIKRRNKQRLAKAAAQAKREAAGDFSHLKNKKGIMVGQPLPQPTLPQVFLDDDELDGKSMRTGIAPSTYTAASSDYFDRKDYPVDYPPMPAYNQGYPQQYVQQDPYHHQHNRSLGSVAEQPGAYEDDYGSTAHLAPYGRDDASSFAGSQPNFNHQQQQGGYPQHVNHAQHHNAAYVTDSDLAYDTGGDFHEQQAPHYNPYEQHAYPPEHQQRRSDGYDYAPGQAL